MSGEIQKFSFEDYDVRIVDQDGDPWFVAKDVCTILGISKYRDTCSRLDDDERGLVKLDTPGGIQKVLVISESGLYHIIARSNKPKAKQFDRWVRKEVLPSIRKKGHYISDELSEDDRDVLILETLLKMKKEQREVNRRQRLLEQSIDRIDDRHNRAVESLEYVEVAEELPEEKPTAAKINELVRAYCLAYDLLFSDVWRKVYREFRYRYGIDLLARARNSDISGMTGVKMSEYLGNTEELFKVASMVCQRIDD